MSRIIHSLLLSPRVLSSPWGWSVSWVDHDSYLTDTGRETSGVMIIVKLLIEETVERSTL